MIDKELNEALKKAKFVALSIGLAVLFYGFLSFWFASDDHSSGLNRDYSHIVRTVFIIMSVSGLAIVPHVRYNMLKSFKEKHKIENEPVIFERLMIARLVSANVLVISFCEMPAFLGMVSVYLTEHFMDFYFFGTLSLIGIIKNYPKEDDWLYWVD